MLRNDGAIFCTYAGPVADTVKPLSDRGTVLRVGNWLMGPVEDDADKFVISKLGTGEVIALLLQNGNVFLKDKVSPRPTAIVLVIIKLHCAIQCDRR